MFFSTPLDALSSPVKYTTSRPLPVAPLVLGSGDAFIHKLSPSSFGIGRGVRKALANFTPYNTVTKDLTAEQSGPRSPSLDQATMDSNVVSRGDFGRVRQSGPPAGRESSADSYPHPHPVPALLSTNEEHRKARIRFPPRTRRWICNSDSEPGRAFAQINLH